MGDKSDVSREEKDRAFNFYKKYVNIMAIIFIILLFISLNISEDGYHWVYGIISVWFTMKSYFISDIERKANKFNMTSTEYLDNIEKNRK